MVIAAAVSFAASPSPGWAVNTFIVYVPGAEGVKAFEPLNVTVVEAPLASGPAETDPTGCHC